MQNNLTIHTYQPKKLAQFIDSFKVYHFDKGVIVQLMPKGIFEIVFQSRECFQHNTYYSSGWEIRPKSFIGGLHNKAYCVKSESQNGFCIAVEFKPNTAKYFIPEKLNYFQHKVVKIEDIWGPSAEHLIERLDNETADVKKISLVEGFLLTKYQERTLTEVDRALKLIMNSRGLLPVTQLATSAMLSVAQFRKRFKEEIGISPSQYSKIVRVNTSLSLIPNRDRTLTDISYALGYFDQSHFIKDFKSVLGVSPKKYISISLPTQQG